MQIERFEVVADVRRAGHTFATTTLTTASHHVWLKHVKDYVAWPGDHFDYHTWVKSIESGLGFERYLGWCMAACCLKKLFRGFFRIMYVGYLLDKEGSMYHQGAVRRSGISLPPQNFVSTPQYTDFTGYHPVPNMDTHAQSAGAWGSPYGAPREDWGGYSLGPPNTIPAPMSSSSPGQVSYCSSDYNAMHGPGSALLASTKRKSSVGQLHRREKDAIPMSGWAKPCSPLLPVRPTHVFKKMSKKAR